MTDVNRDGPLSDAELAELTTLLRRYSAHELDQWELWTVRSPQGPVYVTLSRALPEGADPGAFVEL